MRDTPSIGAVLAIAGTGGTIVVVAGAINIVLGLLLLIPVYTACDRFYRWLLTR